MRHDLEQRLIATKKPYSIYAEVLEDSAVEQFAECMEEEHVTQGFLAPDAHQGYVAPIGSVLKVKDHIYPSFVGYDIGCGMSECMLDIKTESINPAQWIAIKESILSKVPIGFKRQNRSQPVQRAVTDMPMTEFARGMLEDQGSTQIGTLGGGNHFLEVGKSNDGNISIVIHSGSRGVGYNIAEHHMRQCAIFNTDESRYKAEFNEKNSAWFASVNKLTGTKLKAGLIKYTEAKGEFVYRRVRARVDNIEGYYAFPTNSKDGQDYINDMNMALEFALANRKAMIDQVIKAISGVLSIKPKELRFINKNHNHAELVYGHWIHRKGATQALKGMLGVIPGNMVDGSFIVEGLGSKDSMDSSSHGAGRVLSRRKAKEQLDLEEFRDVTKHLVSNHSDSNLDEAPLAYKSIFEVMELQKDLVKVLDRTIPIINIKG